MELSWAIAFSIAALCSAKPARHDVGSYTYNLTTFLLNGEPFQAMGGLVDLHSKTSVLNQRSHGI